MALLDGLTDKPPRAGRPLPEWIGTVSKKLDPEKEEVSATELAKKNRLEKRSMMAVLQKLISSRIVKDGRFYRAFFKYADLKILEDLYNSGKRWRANDEG